ncbi:transmembrane GTPase Fzo1 [Eremomyces bilateralis CBS 781.70]|uniref:Transmembrane GTPase Fzo1 n=1 Tax=Eremomyces bilateralis CBS 781.70 TaxID=1392243 RepID=A0A6G1GAC8_9PEZI|nr:transmembrane GTPase Fzo1 [Eremomyces bilateralis CBS 781.70]KAF1814861.1 transmembrane GTPase Fzo1 [Eremomyces bilateralis CBS 781.70]
MTDEQNPNPRAPSFDAGSSHDGQPETYFSEGQPPVRPNYMTVGAGSTSQSASRLMDMLDHDSGYGASISDAQSTSRGWVPGPTEDRPTPSGTPVLGEGGNSEHDRRLLASHIHQLYYNQNKTSLGRAITRTVDSLKRLQDMNASWPAHYPQVQKSESISQSPRHEPRPSLQHSATTFEQSDTSSPPARPGPRRADTNLRDRDEAESSSSAAQNAGPEPRLVTPELSKDFSILKIDLKMGALSQTELVHSLEKTSIASLLDGQISKSIRHLYSLRERIEDTSSKVLVTGDLNAGKSTFCNALLRRKVLPEDQQPCTAIFCEVLDVRENGGVEEVHAVPMGVVYNRNNESTYHVFNLEDLEKIVVDNERYSMCKIYVKDIRSVDESLLNNGVVDIALIDAPGLNNDSLKTTAVFARQEEIDVVVFVVSAANHFTLSAKEFIFNAAREKAYIFMVVNGFDNIRDKQRCKEMVLKQVHHLSPATFKESSELVHFVSSNAIPVATGPVAGGEPGSPVPKDKGKEKEQMRDFDDLEQSLRRFVLEKRARSKLAPAKTYLTNVLSDLLSLATVNRDVAASELERVTKSLESLEPELDSSRKANNEAGDSADQAIEGTAAECYQFTRETLNHTISEIGTADLGVEYPGLLSAYQFADDIKDAMLASVTAAVSGCEQRARQRTVEGVNMIKQLGLLHIGQEFSNFNFRSEQMFTKRKDALARYVDFEIDATDFFDISSLWERQEKLLGGSMAVTVAGVVGGRLIGGVSWVDGALGVARVVGVKNIRHMIIPGLIATVVLAASYAISSIPSSLPRRLSTKLAAQLAEIDYTHSNATRVSAEVRRALKFPADNLRVGLRRSVEKLQSKKDETAKLKAETEGARKYFVGLLKESNDIRTGVERVDLEGPAPGVAGSYDF